jgi:putative pyruvate formate lyase activating enzyme
MAVTNEGFAPAYLSPAPGELAARAAAARERMGECCLCPRACAATRLDGGLGDCEVGAGAVVASFHPHFGEEDPLVGWGGSGTIFLTSCNLRCVFCQNFEISHGMEGREVAPGELAGMMLQLQGMGCHNINFVTPTHQVPQILEALALAAPAGLRLPLVYNCGGYEAVPTLRLLDGVVDIYMPDFKFADPAPAATYLDAPDYPEVAKAAVREMHRQVGDLVLDEHGIARRGLLVRHLVMPGGVAGTRAIMRFLAREVSRNTYVNIMDQYRPCGTASRYPAIARGISAAEYREALAAAAAEGIHRLDRRRARRILLPRMDL